MNTELYFCLYKTKNPAEKKPSGRKEKPRHPGDPDEQKSQDAHAYL